nr:replication enhancer [Beet curly top virus]
MNVIRDFRTEEPITLQHATNSTPVAFGTESTVPQTPRTSSDPGPVYQLKVQIRFNHNLRKYLNLHKCWIDLTITGSHRTLTGDRFLRGLKNQVGMGISQHHLPSRITMYLKY